MMRLFFSWQTDIPENKKLLRKLLQDICKELGIEYTDDTRDEAGAGHVVDALLRKIENSHIFVGDITIVGRLDSGKAVINSNVAYELGFAEAKLTRNALMLVMNEEHGTYDDMPFDLGKRIITRYKTAKNKLAEQDVNNLRGELKRKIKTFMNTGGTVFMSQLALNKTEKTLLYWAAQEGDGQIIDAFTSVKGAHNYHHFVSIGDSFYSQPLHGQYDTKSEARLRNALETLSKKGLLIKSTSSQRLSGDFSWILSEEGELAAETISTTDVYPLPEVNDEE